MVCRRRLTQEMLTHMSGRVSGGFEAVRLHYMPALKQHILSIIKRYAMILEYLSCTGGLSQWDIKSEACVGFCCVLEAVRVLMVPKMLWNFWMIMVLAVKM